MNVHAPRTRDAHPPRRGRFLPRVPRPSREDPLEYYLAALIALCLIAACIPGCESCRRPAGTALAADAGLDAAPPRSALDAALENALRDALPPLDDAAVDARDVYDPWADALPETTTRGPEASAAHATLAALRAAVGFWRLDHDARSGCPTLEDLLRTPAAAFNTGTMARDPWGSPYAIECSGTYVIVRSAGPDRERGTPDDLVQR